MRVVIVGAGDVGTYIAEDLAESHESGSSRRTALDEVAAAL